MSEPLAVYVHWPFCKAKCPYCDFNSHVRPAVDHAAWATALAREVARHGAMLPGRHVTSIFFGGGTPSLMAPATVQAVLDAIARTWTVDQDCEITMEANPTSAEAERLAAFRACGVNRLSIGVQALRGADLAALGRQHDVAEARATIATARALFPRMSFDLIYARMGQTVADWRSELAEALALGPDHLSLYQLTIEEGTPFHGLAARGALRLPDEDAGAEMYEVTQGLCGEAGLTAYEVSNHARPGFECRHNLAYWQGRDYVGIGPGAHGRLILDGMRLATRAIRAPERWLDQVESGNAAGGTEASEVVPLADEVTERLMMGLRLTQGLDLGPLQARLPGPWRDQVDALRLDRLAAAGLLDVQPTHLRVTPRGLPVLNAILAQILPA
ncbi:radical SAM family heme chaperone HemW [Zavarzinia sp. CC-PAN008]|uniref:radical SAM family heme chaperone HemW n=1 Tax=Zavarzinia sp. CC-PAN008 TaxID=3243332 RepID=UPI003F7446CF